MATVTGSITMSATAGMTVVGSRTMLTYSGGQLTQIGVDPLAAHKSPVGTCVWCGQTNIVLVSHMTSGGIRYACLSSTQAPYIDPNQLTLPANLAGSAGYRDR